MYLIVGLGNPGKKYEHTRHNVGYLFLDYLRDTHEIGDFKVEEKFKGGIATGSINGEKVICLKPTTYMNLSGESLRKVIDFYKIPENKWIVVYDDISMEFGKIRKRDTGSAGGHNGVKSIISHFGEKFMRIKIGVGLNEHYDVSDWVLSKFTKTEQETLEKKVFPEAEKMLVEILNG